MKQENLERDMRPKLIMDLGMEYPKENSNHKARYGIYQCQYCGKEFKAQTHDINKKKGNTKSCGCQCARYTNPHGLKQHPLYGTWVQMKYRCQSPKHIKYEDYGGRGIQVCDRWLNVRNFVEDMYPSYQKGLTLDRVDVNGNYEPSNCRWASIETQSRNTRDIQANNTSGYRGVHYTKDKWVARIVINTKKIHIGVYPTALEAGKAYETYVRVNKLEHNFTPALTVEEINLLTENAND